MANNRLYIVNKETLEYVCIAKQFVYEWSIGNVNGFAEFLESGVDSLVIGSENDTDFYNMYIKNGKNINEGNLWEPVN